MSPSPSSQTPILHASGDLIISVTRQLEEENKTLRAYISSLEDQLIEMDIMSTIPRREGQRTYA